MANTPHPSRRLLSGSSLVNPAPSGRFTRVDQGVDYSNITGPIRAVGPGVISTIYQSLSGFGTTIIEKLKGGQQVYYGLETGGGAPTVSQGQTVQQGQEVAPGLGSGGIEVGYWNPATGHAAGYVPGVTSGGSTPAGQQFQAAISGQNSGGSGGQSTLAQLWIQAGGSPALANTMAAIAMAESSGNVGAVGGPNSNGTYDYGLWQINSSHSQYDKTQLTTDPLYNAQAAVAIEKSQGLGAWSTYNSGAYSAYLSGAGSDTYGGTRPGGQVAGQTDTSSSVGQLFDQYLSLRDMPRTAPPGTKNPFSYFAASFTGNWDNLGVSNK